MTSTSEITSIKTLESQLWRAADMLRGPVGASNYKNYILSFMFYRCICERYTQIINEAGIAEHANALWLQSETDPVARTTLADLLESEDIDFFIPENLALRSIQQQLHSNALIDVGMSVDNAFLQLYQINRHLSELNPKVFRAAKMLSEICANQCKFNTGKEAINDAVRRLVDYFTTDLQLPNTSNFDYFGRVYEYLLAKFSEESGKGGKKGGEFYTPHEVSTLLAEVCLTKYDTDLASRTTAYENICNRFRIYDPSMGSGGLLTTAADSMLRRMIFSDDLERADFKSLMRLKGQEINHETYTLALMNMLLRGHDASELRNGDTLLKPDVEQFETRNLITVANPPWGLKGYNRTRMKDALLADERFPITTAGTADFLWIQHILSGLDEDGIGSVILSLGAASAKRDAATRKALIEADQLTAVVILPAGIFYNVGLPGYAFFFEKNKPEERRHKVAYINLQGLEIKNPNGTNPANLIPTTAIELVKDAIYFGKTDAHRIKWVASDEFAENDFSWSHLLYLKEELVIPSMTELVQQTLSYGKVATNETEKLVAAVVELDTFLQNLEGEK